MAYRVEIQNKAAAEIRKLERSVQRRVWVAIRGLAEDPRPPGCKKLQGLDKTYRIRVGDFRIIYTVDDGIALVVVIKVADRKDVYD